MSAGRRCPVCQTPEPRSFFRLDAVPVHQNLLMASRQEAVACRRGGIDLAFCRACGFVANLSFDPALLAYSPWYENAQCCSASFQAYLDEVAAHLVTRYGLRHKRVIEIGCGKGDFLALLCRLGGNEGVGFDPSFEPQRGPVPPSVTVIRDFYSERYAGYQADLFCCRHTLEHVADPRGFVSQLRRAIGDRSGTAVFFEVPDVRWILDGLVFWDVCYEHCNYFSPASLSALFEAAGFEPRAIRTAFGDQYLWLEAVPARPLPGRAESRPPAVESLTRAVDRFEGGHAARMREVREAIEEARHLGRRAVLWGAGAKGVMLLNGLGMGPDTIECIVDINPRKQGRFVPGTGQEIVAPEFLRDYKPDTVFVMNPNYLAEVRGQMDAMGLRPAVVSL